MRIKTVIIVFIICFGFVTPGKGQDKTHPEDSAVVNFLIKRIAEQQVTSDPYFFAGMYPSYINRQNTFSTKKPDNNIFFNSLIAYTLNDIRPFVSSTNRGIIDSTLNNARPLFAKFKNKKRDTYNFWRTDSSFAFPFPTIFNLFSTDVTLPDDMDDTVLCLLALDADDSTAKAIHTLLQQFTNSESNKVRSVISLYDRFPAYSTWLGIKFPVVFDVSVLCNVLCFVQAYDLPWQKADSASLDVIVETIKNNLHISQPVYASPSYPNTSLILYHIARLMSIKKIPALEALKIRMVKDAAWELQHTNNLLEKIILSSSILKWGYSPPGLSVPIGEVEKQIEQNNFSFFIANLPSYFKDFFKTIATKKHIGFYNYCCPAFNDALLVEYLVLKARASKLKD